jgi:hypothetical protein
MDGSAIASSIREKISRPSFRLRAKPFPHHRVAVRFRAVLAGALSLCAACGGPETGPEPLLTPVPYDLQELASGPVKERFTSELWVRGSTAYTGAWGARGGIPGNALKIWDVSGNPLLVDSVIVSGVSTLGDVQATPDGKYLVVATEPVGFLVIYDISNPRKPTLVTRFQHADIANGVHTSEVQQVNGKTYAFLCIDPRNGARARLVIADITNASAPTVVFSQVMGNPFVHDVFVADGILMTALWDDGMSIWDIGGGGKGGSPSNPVLIGNVKTAGGQVHNIFWYRDPVTKSKKFAIVGQEGPGSVNGTSTGDVHIVDVSDMSNPREVAFYNLPGAGTHNFSVDEKRGILYAAYYNGGVRALSIRGDMGNCPADQRVSDGRCDMRLMQRELAGLPLSGSSASVYIWGVQFVDGKLYASDMINGLWRISTVPQF